MPMIQENIDLSQLTTIKTGGRARYLVECASELDIIDALKHAHSQNLRVLVLGGGSNSLISDQGFDGLVIKIVSQGLSETEGGLVTASAGVMWDEFVSLMCSRGLSGIEAMSGIPGLVGATPVQNVGAYGQEVSETIHSVRAIHRKTLTIRNFNALDCEFAYRDSRFKSREKNQWIITEVVFQLSHSAEPQPKYEELKRALADDHQWTSGVRTQKILAVRNQVLKIRASKGMVLDPADSDTYSLGSFFVNPIVTTKEKDWVISAAKAKGLSGAVPAHSAGDNLWKLSAAWLIENSGIKKGYSLGRAKVSTKHVLAITNPHLATTTEVLALAIHIKQSVFGAFGIDLQQEPEFIA